jgi:Icc-related predicted phosphoesterase
MSDLHCELTRGWDLPAADFRPDFDVMIVAGDLVPRMEQGVAWLQKRVQDKPVIYIPGNHEAYGCDVDRTVAKARAAADGSNVIVLQDSSTRIAGTLFLGATLWTDFAILGNPESGMREAGSTMNDYRKIRHMNHERRLRPIDTLVRHRASRSFLERELSEPRDGSCVVITHHAPCPHGLAPNPWGPGHHDPIAPAYASDLTEMMIGPSAPKLWIFGHTHISADTTIGRTRVVSNSKGYGPGFGALSWDNRAFDPSLVVEI